MWDDKYSVSLEAADLAKLIAEFEDRTLPQGNLGGES